MNSSKFGTAAAALAAFGLVISTPAFAQAPQRSSEALPTFAAGSSSVPYTANAENSWHCGQSGGAAAQRKSVQMDEAGRVVLDPQGSAFACRAPVGSYQAGPFPWAVVLLFIGAGGAAYAVKKLVIKNDSPG